MNFTRQMIQDAPFTTKLNCISFKFEQTNFENVYKIDTTAEIDTRVIVRENSFYIYLHALDEAKIMNSEVFCFLDKNSYQRFVHRTSNLMNYNDMTVYFIAKPLESHKNQEIIQKAIAIDADKTMPSDLIRILQEEIRAEEEHVVEDEE